jgi:uncharacterized protein involved in exopolysaccharide biosynthesis
MHQDSASSYGIEELDLGMFLEKLIQERKAIVGAAFLTTLIAALIAFNMDDVYRAEATLIPAELRQSASPLASQLGGAAAILGIDVNSGGTNRVDSAIAVLTSRAFIVQFIERHGLLVPLFAGDWEAETSSPTVDRDIYDESTLEWVGRAAKPTDLQAYRAFSERLSVVKERATGLIRVSFEWHNPVQAQEWVNSLIRDINREIKNSDLEESNNAISYLRRQLQETQLVEMQRVFYGLIESQIRVSMLADVRDEYIFQVIDPAVVPDRPFSPQRLVLIFIGFIVGFVLGILYVTVRTLIRK